MKRTLRILNLGAGVQSSYLYLNPPVPFDAAIFADTQAEPARVYAHLDWLRSQPGPPILTGTAGNLGANLADGVNADGGRFVTIPAFTPGTGGRKEGRLRRQCTKEYKSDVVWQVIRAQILGLRKGQRFPGKEVEVVQYLGLSADEIGRAARVVDNWKQRWSKPAFPLIDQMISRKACAAWLAEHVPHKVGRSACKFCPFKTDAEWLEMKETEPEEWAEAVRIDALLREPGVVASRGLEQPIFLHRSLIPLEMIDLRAGSRGMFDFMHGECSGFCGQ